MLNRLLKEYIQKHDFNPGVMGILWNPFYIARRGLYLGIKNASRFIKGRTLDVGCATKPYEFLFDVPVYHGLEIDSTIHRAESRADFYYDGGRFPFQDEEYESAITNQVLEHVFNPDEFLSEINRVLKPGGHFLLTIPFVWDEHEQPYDYARYSSFGLKHLLEKHGFEIVWSEKSVNDFRVIFQLAVGYMYKISLRGGFIIKQLVRVFITFPLTVLSFAALALPKNDDLFLDQIVVARKKS